MGKTDLNLNCDWVVRHMSFVSSFPLRPTTWDDQERRRHGVTTEGVYDVYYSTKLRPAARTCTGSVCVVRGLAYYITL